MQRTRVLLSWVATSVLTLVAAVGIVAMTTGNLASTSSSIASAATSASTTAAPAHVTGYTVSYQGDSNGTGD